MPTIELDTVIDAPSELCFDFSRDLDLHARSMAASGERAVAGRVTGLLGPHEDVTWRARHFGFVHQHRSRITVFDRPHHFRDSMVEGRFKRFEHDHFFERLPNGQTSMHDILVFESPWGPLGVLIDRLFMARYLESLLRVRNVVVRAAAEEARMAQRAPDLSNKPLQPAGSAGG